MATSLTDVARPALAFASSSLFLLHGFMSERIYLDWNSTAPLLPDVRDAMIKALSGGVANASSVHREGQAARSIVERARRAIGRAVGAPAQAVVWCGGATEGNNHILRTHAHFAPDPFIVCGATEHASVLEVVEALGASGACRVATIPVDRYGRISLEALERYLAQGASLVSVIWANNENGNIAPISQIAQMCRDAGALVHSDATQALGRIPLDFGASGLDYMTLSLHKMGGPKGIGAIIVREGIVLEAMMAGGHQERGRRPGTENVPAVAAALTAADLVTQKCLTWQEDMERKRAIFVQELDARLPVGYVLRQDEAARLANTLNIAFDGISGEDLLLALDLDGIAASAGSACTAGSIEPSHVILAMGYDLEDAKRSVRLSFGPTTSEAELTEAAARIARVCAHLAKL